MNKNIKELQSELGILVNEFDRLKKSIKKEVQPKSKPVKKSKKTSKKINDDFFKISKLTQDKKTEFKIKNTPQPKKSIPENDPETQKIINNFELILDKDISIKGVDSAKKTENLKTTTPKTKTNTPTIPLENIVENSADYNYLTIKQKLEIINKGIKNKKEAISKIETKSQTIKVEESKPVTTKKKSKSKIIANTPRNKKPTVLDSKKKKTVKSVNKKVKNKSFIDFSDRLTQIILALILIAIILAWFALKN
ncbi:MAG: hypothetical protein V3U80_08515 [Flavobacteriaceae bacterium]